MSELTRQLTAQLQSACHCYPGGQRAVFQAMREKSGSKRADSTLYGCFNPNATSEDKALRLDDFILATEITGAHDALRRLAAHFGYSLASLAPCEPDAPTPEAEMVQDYAAVVAFHKGCESFLQDEIDKIELDALRLAALTEISQTFWKTVDP